MNRSLHFAMLFLLLPFTAGVAEEAAPTAWEMLPYRVHVLTAVESSPSLPPKFEQEFPSDLLARMPSLVGGAWRLEAGAAPAELRHRILHAPASLTGDDVPAAAKKGDKVIFLGIAAGENGYMVRARELDLITGLWNTTTTRIVPQAVSVKQEAIWCLIAAFAPQARIEKVDDKIVTLKLRAAALARRDGNLPLFLPGTVFRPVLVNTDARGTMQAGRIESIAWTYMIPTETKTASSPFTTRIETGLSGTVIPEYHPTRLRLALGVSPSRDSTKIKLVAEGSGAPLEGYEVASQEPEVAGKPGVVLPLGRSESDGIVEVLSSTTGLRTLLIRHGEEVLARLPLVPGLAQEVTITLADDRPRLAIESALSSIQDNLVDLVARREVLVSRIKAAAKESNSAAADKLKEQLRKLPTVEQPLAELTRQQQAIESLEGPARQKMQKRLSEIRNLADKLKAENPGSKL